MNTNLKEPKYFVISDIHSFYTEFKHALFKAGFRKTNKNHVLIVLGDLFDRGPDTIKLYNYLKTIPSNRLILIKGNHEDLYLSLLKKSFPESWDFLNGTVETFCQIAGIDEKYLLSKFWAKKLGKEIVEYSCFDKQKETWDKVRSRVKKSEITKFLKSDRWLNYYELNNYIFVHSFIPIQVKSEFVEFSLYCSSLDMECYEYMKDWRILAGDGNWIDATWGCPYIPFQAGLFDEEIKNNKILVCGHWPTSDFHKVFEHDSSGNSNIYYGDNLIAIDASTVISKRCNILVLDECGNIIK